MFQSLVLFQRVIIKPFNNSIRLSMLFKLTIELLLIILDNNPYSNKSSKKTTNQLSFKVSNVKIDKCNKLCPTCKLFKDNDLILQLSRMWIRVESVLHLTIVKETSIKRVITKFQGKVWESLLPLKLWCKTTVFKSSNVDLKCCNQMTFLY